MPEMHSLRNEYGKLLVHYGEIYKNIVVFDGDLAKSTKTELFKEKFPERFFDMGISEADMMSTAAGFASTGKIPFCSTFALFATGRAWDQVRNSICYPEWAVKIVSSHAGLSVGEDGASHQALEDIALMRVIPKMTIIAPSDIIMLRGLMKQIIEYNSYLYMRLPRNNLPVLYNENETFEIGKAKTIKKGKDITIIANGAMLHIANNTLKRFESMGIDTGLVDMFTVKPLDNELLLNISKNTKGFLVCEEHQMIGGLGSAVAEFLCENNPKPIERIGINDSFGESGTPEELFSKYKIDENAVLEKGKKLYDRIKKCV